jgi:N-acetylated-alpha-linked acidic dipeptidase
VIAEIRGTTHPDEKVIVGGHSGRLDVRHQRQRERLDGRDGDRPQPGRCLKQGWHPDRTIVLAGWDGEEYGLLGSTEFGEQFAKRSDAQRVAYLNMDGVSGRSFSAGGVPSATSC